jgi:hypothetical protein
MLNTTVEILEFEPIGAQVPNRGSYSGVPKPVGQPDIDIYGLRYLQRVADGKNHQPLHVEPGFWLYMPTSTVWPVLGPSVVRQAVIPHGNSLLALGEVKIPFESTGKPNILETSSIPTRDGDPNFRIRLTWIHSRRRGNTSQSYRTRINFSRKQSNSKTSSKR